MRFISVCPKATDASEERQKTYHRKTRCHEKLLLYKTPPEQDLQVRICAAHASRGSFTFKNQCPSAVGNNSRRNALTTVNSVMLSKIVFLINPPDVTKKRANENLWNQNHWRWSSVTKIDFEREPQRFSIWLHEARHDTDLHGENRNSIFEINATVRKEAASRK